MERLKRSLQKKSAQVGQLVASQRALLKSRAAREDELNEQVTKLRQEIDQGAVQRKLGEQGRKHTEQQMEAMKQSLKSKSEELGAARHQLLAATQERDAAQQRIVAMEEAQQQQEKIFSDLQEKYNHSLQQVSATRLEHKSELHDLQVSFARRCVVKCVVKCAVTCTALCRRSCTRPEANSECFASMPCAV